MDNLLLSNNFYILMRESHWLNLISIKMKLSKNIKTNASLNLHFNKLFKTKIIKTYINSFLNKMFKVTLS